MCAQVIECDAWRWLGHRHGLGRGVDAVDRAADVAERDSGWWSSRNSRNYTGIPSCR